MVCLLESSARPRCSGHRQCCSPDGPDRSATSPAWSCRGYCSCLPPLLLPSSSRRYVSTLLSCRHVWALTCLDLWVLCLCSGALWSPAFLPCGLCATLSAQLNAHAAASWPRTPGPHPTPPRSGRPSPPRSAPGPRAPTNRCTLVPSGSDLPGVIEPVLEAQARQFARAEEIPMLLVLGAQRAQGARFSGAEGGRGRAARCLGRGRPIHAGSPFLPATPVRATLIDRVVCWRRSGSCTRRAPAAPGPRP